ncbi:hypothetical protein B296_00026908 [Ensete ventricosum]|uniref:Uncharacterized protein n=1 Tax=Ensete ventricosum TaxID=4639 RepID=A0A426X4V7_ENSVE|nr:hypothetical protein B296_00026908 [Ensete ventricosum]
MVGNSPGVHRELTEGIGSLPGWCKGVRHKIIEGSRKAYRELGRGGSRPQHCSLESNPYPSYLMVQSFSLDMRKGNRRHKCVRLPRLYFSLDLWL